MLETVLLLASGISLLTIALVEVYKSAFPNVDKGYLPLISMLIGVVAALILFPIFGEGLYVTLVSGLISGLSSCGLFDLVKGFKKGE